jgi:hypothetical protein
MTSSRKKPGSTFCATLVLVVVLLAFPLSIGPWYWAVTSGNLPLSVVPFDHVYDPLRWLISRSPESVQHAAEAYISLWQPAQPMEYHGP